MLPVQAACTITTRCDAPPGSGLGSSGAMDVALVAALALARAEQLTAREIAEQAWYLETVEAKIPGGKQDQFAAALGGFQRLTFRDPDVGVEPITLDPAFATALARRTVLCYTGRSRVAGNEGPGHRDGGGAARGRRCPCGDAAFAQLGASAGARSGDAHARNGPARERLDGRRGARREGR